MLSNNIDRTPEEVLTFAGYDVTKLAKEYGTPLYLMDEARIRANCGCICRRSVTISAPALCHCTPARRRPSSRCTASWRRKAWAWTWYPPGNCTPLSAPGFPAERIYFHGNCKTDADLAYGVSQGIGLFCGGQPGGAFSAGKDGGRGQCHPEDPSAGNAGH